MPCNLNHRDPRGAWPKAALRRIGCTPMEVNNHRDPPTASRWATAGMRASLVSRELIADSVETSFAPPGHIVRRIGRDRFLRQDCPRHGDGVGPGRTGPRCCSTAHDHGRDGSTAGTLPCNDVFEAIGAVAAGTMSEDGPGRAGVGGLPGAAGACGGQYTANTMAMIMEVLGLSPTWVQRHPRDPPRTSARRSRSRPEQIDVRRGNSTCVPAGCSPGLPSRTRLPLSRPLAGRPTLRCTCSRWRTRSGST